MKLSFRFCARIEEPGKKVALVWLSSVVLKIRIAAPLAGAAVNWMVVALAKVNAVVLVPLTLTLMSVVARYGKVKE